MKHYRQGDVLIVSTCKIERKNKLKDGDRCILAFGEATGHAHEIKELNKVIAYVGADGTEVSELDVKEAVDLVHQEHDAIVLEPGLYRIIHQREYSPEEIRRVAD